MARKVNETLDMGGAAKVINLPAPSGANDAARKADIDAVSSSLKFMQNPVRAVATANVTVASPGGTIDSVTLSTGDRVLLAGQSTASQNGTYTFNGASSPLTRTADLFVNGTVVLAGSDGSVYADTMWVQSHDDPITVGTTAMTFTQLPFEATSAGTGLSKSGNVIALVVPVAVANGGTNATTLAGAKSSLGFPTTYESDFGDGAASSFTITHNLGNKYCSVVVTLKGTGADEDCAVVRSDANTLVLSAEAWSASPPGASAYHVACRG